MILPLFHAEPFDTSVTAVAVLRIAAVYLILAGPLARLSPSLSRVGRGVDMTRGQIRAEGVRFGFSCLLAGPMTFAALVIASGGGIAADPISLGAFSVAISVFLLGVVCLAAPERVAAMNATPPSLVMPALGLACLALTFLAH